MTTLTPDQLADITAQLHAEREALLRSVRALEGSDADLAESQLSGAGRNAGEGEADIVITERMLVAKLEQSSAKALTAIDAALSRLADGTYGSCAECNAPIEHIRLEGRPRVTTCLKCASRR